MNREAAALGVPAYTPFAARLGAVDRRLIDEGRLRRLDAARGRAPGAPRARGRRRRCATPNR